MANKPHKTTKQNKNCYLVLSQNNFMHGAFHRTPEGFKLAEIHAQALEAKNKEKYFVK